MSPATIIWHIRIMHRNVCRRCDRERVALPREYQITKWRDNMFVQRTDRSLIRINHSWLNYYTTLADTFGTKGSRHNGSPQGIELSA